MERQTITVDIAPGNNQIQRLKSSQGDIGRPLGVYITQNGVALDCSAYTADLYILKPDGNYFTATATVDATEHNLITWETAKQETPVAGDCAAQIRILSNGDDVGTARFVEYVEASPGFVGESSESVVESLMEYVRQAAASAETASGAASSATGSANAASGSASSAAQSASAAAGSASTAHTDAETASQAAQTAQDVAASIPEDYSTLSEDVTSLKSAFERLDANVITESAGPAPIVSIADGADGMPMRKVEVAIEPVQDLHGYDAPWPAGGGKNKCSYTPYAGVAYNAEVGTVVNLIEGGPINVNGSTISFEVETWGNRNFRTSVLHAGTYHVRFAIASSVDGSFRGSFYTIGNNGTNDIIKTSSTYGAPNATKEHNITVEEGDYICLNIGSNVAATITITNLQIESGSTATAWTPYSNICPISGWTGAKVTRTGKNLFDVSLLFRVNNNTLRSRIFFLPSGEYTFRRPSGDNNKYNWYVRRVESADSYSPFTSLVTGGTNVSSGNFSLENGSFVHLEFYNTTGIPDSTIQNIQIELGSTATAYEPYQGQTYEVTFPAEAGTVYGGTLDVVSGRLMVDRAMVDLGTLNWSTSGYNIWQAGIAGMEPPLTVQDRKNGIQCSIYGVSASTALNDSMTDKSMLRNSNIIFIRDTSYSDAPSFKTAVSGQQLVYKLAQTIEIDLTTTEITTLLGENHLFADAGNTAVTYPADTKLYIDKKIVELQALILENNG